MKNRSAGTTRLRADDAALRARIRAVAARHLSETGAGGLSLREVARDAGISPSELLQHFESREALLRTLAGDAVAALAATMRESVEVQAEDPRDELVAMGHAYRRWARGNPALFTLLFSHERWSQVHRGELVRRLDPVRRAAVDLLQRQRVAGAAVLPPDSPDLPHGIRPELLAGAGPAGDPSPAPSPDLPAWVVHQLVLMWTALHGFVSFELTGDAALLLADPETMYDELARRSVDTIYGVVAG